MPVEEENQGKEGIVESVWLYWHTSTPLSVTFTNWIVVILRTVFVSTGAKSMRINQYDEASRVYPEFIEGLSLCNVETW